eukprot:3839228-Alexandrium_andersonii.AAC.1
MLLIKARKGDARRARAQAQRNRCGVAREASGTGSGAVDRLSAAQRPQADRRKAGNCRMHREASCGR